MNIDYKIIPQKRKTLSIQIDRGEVIVKAPLKYPQKEIERFIEKKEKWILKHLENSLNKPKFAYKNSESFHYLGKKYTVEIIEKSIQEKIEIFDDRLLVFSHRTKSNENHNKLIIDKWIKNQALDILTTRYNELFHLFSYKNKPDLFIKVFKSRWGAYHKKFLQDYITLNQNLIMYPMECIDYVIVHELAHKKQQNHSKKFYALVEEKYPDWKKAKKLLDGKVD